MSIPYESLTPERFQRFCQSLAQREMSDFQFFPVGQPDGGRDGIAEKRDVFGRLDVAVLQVKFVRDPARIADVTVWLNRIIDDEASKIETLMDRGATRYLLATNLSGTAHLDVGSIDKASAVLADRFPELQTQCWWRSDLDGRLANAWDLKWTYPELFTGTDFVRLLLEARTDSRAEHTARALKAYIADQHAHDREVRFKQVDLSNNLFAMFTDVPAKLSSFTPLTRHNQELMQWLTYRSQLGQSPSGRVYVDTPGKPTIGAAELLLNSAAELELPPLVILGGPGQGKSTLLQYVVQVHRTRLLQHSDLKDLPPEHQVASVRLPFRIELRDFGRFLRTGNPWTDESPIPKDLPRTLEGFIAAQVQHRSGGGAFTVDDLFQYFAIYPVILALDGLDEVVHVDDRKLVVAAITDSYSRLRSNAKSLITIVTSRPVAFADSPSLSGDTFLHLDLAALPPPLIEEYSDRWAAAHHLTSSDRTKLNATLDKRLRESHFRELARNPMQLAILLNLIHRLGDALPDQRTSLYGRYMELFLDREADKSPAIRDYRDLIIRLHGKIAWHLQSDAESGGAGRIQRAELASFSEKFLESEGWSPTLFGDLFTGAFERVGALVSRQQDTFEFEVQPVREYFTGTWLYDSAPIAPVGSPQSGTRPERFDALAQRPYWLNVLRFYAGSYSTGELPSLADRLDRLASHSDWRITEQVRLIASSLLIDRTFEQDLRMADKVLDIATQHLGSHHSLDVAETGQILQAGWPMGRKKLLQRAVSAAARHPNMRQQIAHQLASTYDAADLQLAWRQQQASLEPADLANLGLHLALLTRLTVNDLEEVFGTDLVLPDVVQALYRACHTGIVDAREDVAEVADRLALDGLLSFLPEEPNHPLWSLTNRVESLSRALANTRTSPIKREAPHALWEHWNETLRVGENAVSPSVDWSLSSSKPWRDTLRAMEGWFGDEPLGRDVATSLAGVSDRRWRRTKSAANPADLSASVLDRARYARLCTDYAWWSQHLSSDDASIVGWLLSILLGYGPPHFLEKLQPQIHDAVAALPAESFPDLVFRLRNSLAPHQRLRRSTAIAVHWRGLSQIDPLVLYLLEPRLADTALSRRHSQISPQKLTDIPNPLRNSMARAELLAFSEGRRNWDDILRLMREASEPYAVSLLDSRQAGTHDMPLDVASRVIAEAAEFPVDFVRLAEDRALAHAVGTTSAVSAQATVDGWFG